MMASGSSQNYKFIDDESSLKQSLCELKSLEQNALLAVDCEGVNLSRKGELTIVTVATKEKAYIFDICKLKQVAFDSGLREILEDKSREKLMFDGRQDSDSLMHQFKVKLTSVLDVQLLEVMQRRENSASSSGVSSASHKRRSQRLNEVENIKGFSHCIEQYIKDKEVLKTKTKVKEMMKVKDGSLWKERPLTDEMLRYCAIDALELFKLYEKLKGTNDEFLPRLRVASERYVDMYRCKGERNFDDYETNSFLPLDVIPDKGTLTFPFANLKQCVKCSRLFPYEEFSKTQLRNQDQKCRVCKKVKKERDDAVVSFWREQKKFYSSSDDDYNDFYYDEDNDDHCYDGGYDYSDNGCFWW